MTGVGGQLRSMPGEWADARLVAETTMRRVRRNAEQLIGLLDADGYEFAPGEGMVVFEPPPEGIAGQLDDLEAVTGVLPLSLRAWYEQVGRLSLMGRHPAWDYHYPDPLVVDAPPESVLSEHQAWQQDRGTAWDTGGFTIGLAPD